MNKRYIDLTSDLEGLEKIRGFLKDYGIDSQYVDIDKHGYSRTIKFEVYGQVYKIVWYNNESKLIIGENKRASFIVFRYMYFDNSMPILGGNQNIGFAYKMVDDRYSPFAHETFRIPLEN